MQKLTATNTSKFFILIFLIGALTFAIITLPYKDNRDQEPPQTKREIATEVTTTPKDFALIINFTASSGGGLRPSYIVNLVDHHLEITSNTYKVNSFELTDKQLLEIYKIALEYDLINFQIKHWSEKSYICACQDCGPQGDHKLSITANNITNDLNFLRYSSINNCTLQYAEDIEILQTIYEAILNTATTEEIEPQDTTSNSFFEDVEEFKETFNQEQLEYIKRLKDQKIKACTNDTHWQNIESNSSVNRVNIYNIDSKYSLLEIVCIIGAYQTYSEYYLFSDNIPKQVAFEFFQLNSNGQLQPTTTSGLAGSYFSPEHQTIEGFGKFRGIGDCGYIYSYSFSNCEFLLESFKYRECDDTIFDDEDIEGLNDLEWEVVR